MINVVVPIIDNVQQYNKAISSICSSEDVRVIAGVVQELESQIHLPKSAKMIVFKTGSKKEEIINSLRSDIANGKVVICRRPFTKDEFERLVQSNAQVTYFASKKTNFFSSFLKTIVGWIAKFLFGVKFFDGDISLIAFDSDMGEVLQNVNSLSYATRVDRWRGIEHSVVQNDLSPVQIEKDKTGLIKTLIWALLAIIIPVVTTVLVAVFVKNIGFVIGMVLFCIMALGFCGSLLLLCVAYFNSIVGKRYFPDAERL